MTLLQKLRTLLTRRDKKILMLIAVSTIFISLLEVVTLSATMLFISAILHFKSLNTSKYALMAFKYIGPLSNSRIILYIGVGLILLYVSRCFITFGYTYCMQIFLERRRQVLTSRFFQNYLQFNYHEFTIKNPATISKLIFTDAGNVMAIISASLIVFAEAVTLLLIYASLLFINWKMTIVLSFLLSTTVVFILKTFSKKNGCQWYKSCSSYA